MERPPFTGFVDSRIKVDSNRIALVNPDRSGNDTGIEHANISLSKSLSGTRKREKIIKHSSKRIADQISLRNRVNPSSLRKLKMKSQKYEDSIK